MNKVATAVALSTLLLVGCQVKAGDTVFTVIGDVIDCATCEPMVAFGRGHFKMGQDATNDDEGPGFRLEPKYARSEPVVWVDITKPFAVGKYEVTRRLFQEFVTASGYVPSQNCSGAYSMNWKFRPELGSRDNVQAEKARTLAWLALQGIVLDPQPGFMDFAHNDFNQTDDDPVTCISRPDAVAFIKWYNIYKRPAGVPQYRLMEPIEYEYVARAGSASHRYTWGDDWHDSCLHANIGDMLKGAQVPDAYDPPIPCTDGYAFTAPVGSFPPNAAGLYDIDGNVTEMLAGYAVWNNDPPPQQGNLAGYNRCLSEAPKCDVNYAPAAGGSWYKSEMKNDISHYSFNALVNDKGNPEGLPFNGFRLARDCRSPGPC